MANWGDSRYRYDSRSGCLDVVFHAILPLHVWEWIEGESHLYVRFENALLGDMKQDWGEFQINRMLTEDTAEFESVISIPLKALLTHDVGIPFTYVVYSPRAEKSNYLREYLHGTESTFRNCYRYLAIPARMRIAGGKFHQYDTMIYPPPEFVLKQVFKGVVSGQESHTHPDIQCPPPELMREKCLIYYLKVYEPFLKSKIMPDSVAVLIAKVVQIYIQLAEHLIYVHSRVPGTPPSYEIWPVDNLKKVMSHWLSSIVSHLDGVGETREKKLFSAVLLSIILYKLMQLTHRSAIIKLGGKEQFNLEQVITLLEMLVLSPNVEKKECTEYDFLLGMLSEQRETASQAITALCDFAASKSGWNNPVWLGVSALAHFLSGASEPFSQLNPVKAMSVINAELQNPLYKEVRERRYPPEAGFDVQYRRLSALIEADPLLLLKLASVCPIEEASTLFMNIPVYICVAWVIEVLVKGGKISSQWVKTLVQKVDLLTEKLKHSSTPTTEKEFQDLHLASQASSQLLTELKFKTEEKLTNNAVLCMKAALSLVLYTTQQLSVSQSDDSFVECKPCKSIVKRDIFVSLQQTLSEWISAVLGSGDIKVKKPRTEIDLWYGILSVDCPPPLKEEWIAVNKSVLESRVTNVNPELRVDLLVYIEKHCIETSKPVLQIITNVVIQATAEGLNLLCEREAKTAAHCLEKLLRETGPSKQTGKLMGSILANTSHTHAPTLKNLVEWPLWPPLLKAFKNSVIASGMERESASICRDTASLLEVIAKRIVEGSVKIEELENISALQDNKEQMKVLCSLVPFSSDVDSQQLLQASDVVKGLKLRLEEYQCYKLLKVHLGELCNHMQAVDGASQLLAELQNNYGGEEIRAVCQKADDGRMRSTLFRGVVQIQPMLKPFYTMCNKHKSYTFLVMWEEQMAKAKALYPTLAIEDIPEQVWEPTFKCCRRFLEQLENREIKLANVDKYLEGQKNVGSLRTDLQTFSAAIAACCNTQRNNTAWIPGLVEVLQKYWFLCNARDAAQALISLQAKVQFKPTPQFHSVQRLLQEVDSGLRDRRLCDLPTELIETRVHLKKIAEHPRQVQCLKTLVCCWQVIEWIKHSSPRDLRDLYTFVDIASNTEERSEMDCDKLQDLLTVGSGFQSLIYGFKPGYAYDCLVGQLDTVWEALRQTNNLSKLLEQCSGNLDWYSQVKEENEKSVEAAAYSQVCRIKESGEYKIGSAKEEVCYSIHQVISLKVRDGKEHDRAYTLAELEELQSKLLLTTKSDTDKQKVVETFSDDMQIVQLLGEKLMQLQRAGNPRYFGWSVRFSCEKVNQVVLKKWLNHLNVELDCWNEQVKQARRKYYHLNNFTNKQLCAIRRVLCRAKFAATVSRSEIKPGIVAMLQSISSEISSEQIWHSTHIAIQVISNPRGSCFAVISSSVGTMLRAPQNVTSEEFLSSDINEIDKVLDQKQQEVFQHLTEKDGFPKDLARKAVEQCGSNLDDAYLYCWKNLYDSEFKDEISLGGISDHSADADLAMKHDQLSIEEFCKVPLVSPGQGFSKSQQALYDRLTKEYDFPVDVAQKAVQRHGGNEDRAYEYCRTGIDPESEDEISLGGFSVKGVESDLKVDYNITREHLVKKPGALVLQSPPQPHHQTTFTGSAERTVLDPDHTDGVFVNEPTEEPHLRLEEVGVTLEHLRRFAERDVQQRPFEKSFDTGSPNLIVTDPGKVLVTVLALYMADQSLPLPTFEEVLVCTASTTFEEVNLLWHRALGDPGYRRLFCLVHAERLSYGVSEDAFQSLMEVSDQQEGEYRLVIICSSEDEESPVVSKFHQYLKKFPILFKNSEISGYLKEHFVSQSTGQVNHAAHVDHEKSTIRLVISNRAGMGKSLLIRRLAEKLEQVKSKRLLFQTAPQQNRQAGGNLVTITIHGPEVSSDDIMDMLTKPSMQQSPKILHLDVAPEVVHKVDTILFNMLILGGLCDTQGRVWRRNASDMCAVEMTILKEHGKLKYPGSTLVGLLPSHECNSPVQVHKYATSQKGNIGGMDENNFKSGPYQCVYQYLKKYEAKENLDDFSFRGAIHGTPRECLSHMIQFCGIRNPSWRELSHFVQFLYLQLKSSEQSVFCNVAVSGLSGMKSFVIKFMIRMSRDFATPSLKGEVAQDEDEEEALRIQEELQIYHIVERKLWEENVHPYIFFNEDGESITFVNVRVVLEKQGEKQIGWLLDPVDPRTRLEYDIMTGSLFNELKHNRIDFEEDYKSWRREDILLKLTRFLGLTGVRDPDPSYALNVDNFVKILAIQTRFRCGIPVIIMGETGCGKTRLIRYMCDFTKRQENLQNMFIMKVHGGTSEQDIINVTERLEEQIAENRKHKMDTVLFFDEANTTEAINLIKEVMCDHRIRGRHLPSDIKFIAACNPYKKHTKEMIKKLESAGLGFFIKTTDTQERIGNIPLRQLVYRVHALPPSMRPLVYDFGQIPVQKEMDYTHRIVQNYNLRKLNHKLSKHLVSAISHVLTFCQNYMRNRKDECSFVSLRDVERSMIVFEYFYSKHQLFFEGVLKKAQDENQILLLQLTSTDRFTHSLVLSISVCYLPRLQSLQSRKEFVQGVTSEFRKPLSLSGGDQQFHSEVKWCQEVLLESMQLDMNTAKNVALRENVFMMAVCIELRIPLFLVGKPGSSKSLAKSIVAKSMLGQGSQTKILKSFKQVRMVSYQCSQLSTSETIVEVFNKAMALQRNQNRSNFVAVVVLDEVGLAEDSPYLPLKALHPLLEDGTEGADSSHQILERKERVAFIGISNWALDPAKMNRGIMVTRTDPDVAELELSARSICSNEPNDPITRALQPYLKPIAEAYLDVCRQQSREFFGLRDFYSTIKMLYWMCKETELTLTWHHIEHAVKRNFGGFDEFDPLIAFCRKVIMPGVVELSQYSKQLHSKLKPDSSPVALIKANLKPKETEWNGEDRYLLFITKNYAALWTLQHFLLGDLSMEKPLILFGSRFPKEKEYAKVCRDISQIKICMETGRTVILLNLENLYESLYDLLNQYYTTYGENRYVDLGLQSHRERCQVHRNFKLILIAEKMKVYQQFPIPLINRMEKHFVFTEYVLTRAQMQIVTEISDWIKKFSNVATGNFIFKEPDAFIGYQTDTPATVVLQATHLIQSSHPTLTEESAEWKDEVKQKSKRLLIYTASPDALIRLQKSALKSSQKELCRIYFSEQHHSSLQDYLLHHASAQSSKNYFQITTHSHLLSKAEVEELGESLDMPTFSCLLQEFDTEQDFLQTIRSDSSLKPAHEPPIVVNECPTHTPYAKHNQCCTFAICGLLSENSAYPTI